jgi:alkanesulfonate monooxygenase SsuD/methylene tetrahydromethanopterin reductase-like flavin-dependent oxidoreductase (luciferase family)
LFGTPETIRQRFAEFEAAGVQELILTFYPRNDPEQLRRFARAFLV